MASETAPTLHPARNTTEDILARVNAGTLVTFGLALRYRPKAGLTFVGFLTALSVVAFLANKVSGVIPIVFAAAYILLFGVDVWLGGMCIGLDKNAIMQADTKRTRMLWSDVGEIRVARADDSSNIDSPIVAVALISKADPAINVSFHRYENLDAIANAASVLANVSLTLVNVPSEGVT